MAPPVVLVVDDEPDLVELVTLTLSRMQLATQSAGDVASAKRLLKSQRFDLCLTALFPKPGFHDAEQPSD